MPRAQWLFGCRGTAIDTIWCLGNVPPTIEDDTFLDANPDMTVVVPEGSLEAYREAWGEGFKFDLRMR